MRKAYLCAVMRNIHTLLPLLSLAAQACAQADERPNIVYIMADDHTAQMMSCYGNSPVPTPNIDRIAQGGVLFSQSFVANSLSGPSRACMLTGKHSHKNGFTGNEHGVFDGSQQTMPKLMQEAGYQTALIGKWHLVSTPTGFDHYDILPEQGDYYNPDFVHKDGSTTTEQGYCTNIITDKSIEWLEGRDRDKPFILFVHHKACHRNWLPEMKYLREYEDTVFPIPPNFHDTWEGRTAAQQQEMSIASEHDMDIVYDNKVYLPGDTSRLSDLYLSFISRMNAEDSAAYHEFYDSLSLAYRQHPLAGDELAEWKFQRYMRDYAKVTRSLDDNVGRLLDYLEEEGLLSNTLVVYTSDQGFYMGEHGWFDKRFMYEESLSTPLVMHLPDGYERRGNIDEMVQNIDYAPTFLELAGASVPSDMQGVSLLPLLTNDGERGKKWRNAVYYHYYEYPAEHSVKRHYGIRTSDGWKLIHFYNDIDEWELFDLRNDPTEMHNLYGEPGYEKVTRQLHKRLRILQRQYDDPIERQLRRPASAQ